MKYGFIGCGNMGGALAKCTAKAPGNDEICLYDKDTEKAKALCDLIGASFMDIETLAGTCDYIFLGVKPQVLPFMLKEINGVLAERKDKFVLVSMAAGISIDAVLSMSESDGKYSVIRIMPNIAVSEGEGMILYCSRNCSKEETDTFLNKMSGSGKLAELPESMIDAGSAISGCGPAYAFLFAEALADGGVACGLPRDKAMLLAAQTLLGSAKLLLESGKHPGELKDAVCSPGGTTIEGVLALEKSAFRAASAEAVIAAYEKTLKLKK